MNILKKIANIFLSLIFGKESLDGFYKPNEQSQSNKYEFSSIFPDKESMDITLKAIK